MRGGKSTAWKDRVEVLCETCAAAKCGKKGARKNLSAAMSETRQTYEYRKAASERTTVTWQNPEHRARHEAAVRTPEYRKRRSEDTRRRAADPQYRARLFASLKNSEKHKAAMLARPVPPCPNWQTYGDHKFRSKWERDFATFLDQAGSAWKYEPERFVLSDGSAYTPDFFVSSPFGDCYVELHRMKAIKPGDERKVSRLRLAESEFATRFGIPLVLLGDDEVYSMQKTLHAMMREDAGEAEKKGERVE